MAETENKRLVICSDGTWQSLRSKYPTNVVKLAKAVRPRGKDGKPQIVYYDPGVGTGGGLDRLKGGAFGEGLDRNIIEAYRFLCLNFEVGDELYLLGFSRGAYTVRSLAGLIYSSGILKREHMRSIPKAYELYRDAEVAPADREAAELRGRFAHDIEGSQFSHRPEISFLGCWDTVGALGVPDLASFTSLDEWFNGVYEFHDTELGPIVKKAAHAVAIDEQRKVFPVTEMKPHKAAGAGQLKQVWFPGDHSCIGGGDLGKRGLSDRCLDWMIGEIGKAGLALSFDLALQDTKPDHRTRFEPSGLDFFGVNRKFRHQIDDLDITVKRRWRDLGDDYRPRTLDDWLGPMLTRWANENLD